MGHDFGDELKSELGHLEYFYNFMYFNDALTDEEKWAAYENFEFVTPNDFITRCVPFYHRTNKCSIGEKFALKKLFKTEYYHTHYEDYDCSKYEYKDFD